MHTNIRHVAQSVSSVIITSARVLSHLPVASPVRASAGALLGHCAPCSSPSVRRSSSLLSVTTVRTASRSFATSDRSIDGDGVSEGDGAQVGPDEADASENLWRALEDTEAPLASLTPPAAAAATSSSSGAPFSDASSTHTDKDASGADTAAPRYVWVALHNMPRNWMHEEITNFVHQVATHAGVPTPVTTASPSSFVGDGKKADVRHGGEGEEEDNTMMEHVTSPFIAHLHIPFGRRTGLVYGTPKLQLRSAALALYLTRELTFEADDFRSRIYFTKLKLEELPPGVQRATATTAATSGRAEGKDGAEGATEEEANSSAGVSAPVRYIPIEETVEEEQQDALRTLELDRYLFAPDLLLDIVKSHQRRLVTRNEKVLLDAFVDGEEDTEGDEEEEGGEGREEANVEAAEEEEYLGNGSTASGGRRPKSAKLKKPSVQRRRKTRPRAGTQKHLGRGSLHNMLIPKPYVEGRNL